MFKHFEITNAIILMRIIIEIKEIRLIIIIYKLISELNKYSLIFMNLSLKIS